MRVNDQNAVGSAASDIGRTQDVQTSDRTGAAQSSNPYSNGDRVEFSSTLGSLSQAISAESSQRSSRVQAIAAAYQNGTYSADPMTISKAMVADAATAGSF
jgi:anti-sigma28 factor (negative regulator of flagellin synthesis)